MTGSCRCGFQVEVTCPFCENDIQRDAYGEGFSDASEAANKRVAPLVKALRQIAEITCDHPSSIPCHRDIARAALEFEDRVYPERITL